MHSTRDARRTSPRVRLAAVVGAAVLAASGLAGCGQGAEETVRTSSEPVSTASASPEPSAAPTSSSPTTAGTEPVTGDGTSDAFLPLAQQSTVHGSGSSSIMGVRVGQNEGFTRVVLDLEGDAGDSVGWFATAMDAAVQDGSGDPLDVDGDRFLQLGVTGIANGATETTDSAGRAAFLGAVDGTGDLVEEVYVGGAWEGQAQVVIGLDDDATEYRVTRLSDPARVVVDVR